MTRSVPRHRVTVWPILLFSAAATACGFSGASRLAGPDTARCAVTLGGGTTLPATQTQTTLQVATSRDCAWSAASNQTWLSVAPGNGQGDGTVSLVAAANPASGPRVAVVTINDTGWTLTQTGATVSASAPAPAQPGGTTSEPPPVVGSPPASPETPPGEPPIVTSPDSSPSNPEPGNPSGADSGSGNGSGGTETGNGNGDGGQGNGNGNGNGQGNGNGNGNGGQGNGQGNGNGNGNSGNGNGNGGSGKG